MPADNMPSAEIDIGEPLVRALLTEQYPDLAGLALVEIASGWDNAIFRLGEDLSVRLPRRALAAALVEHEQRWLPELARTLPLPVPSPVRIGRPGSGYPWSWSVCRWLPGTSATRTPPDDPLEAAATLGAFLSALHREAPADAPVNPYRGVALDQREAGVIQRAAQLADRIDADAVVTCWTELASAPRWNAPPVWLHGDLHPGNVLVHEGRVSAVIDFGDITSGDPATDLAVAWMMFPAEARPVFRMAAGGRDEATWRRARAWALSLALAYLARSADNPMFARLGADTLRAVLADR
jgi:aminoglycoside phosphotransferase (APT) family kinase protein